MKLFPDEKFVIETNLSGAEVKKVLEELMLPEKRGFFIDHGLWFRLPENRTYRGEIKGDSYMLYVQDISTMGRLTKPKMFRFFFIEGEIKQVGNKTIVASRFKINRIMGYFFYFGLVVNIIQLVVYYLNSSKQNDVILTIVVFTIVVVIVTFFIHRFLKKEFNKAVNYLTQLFEGK